MVQDGEGKRTGLVYIAVLYIAAVVSVTRINAAPYVTLTSPQVPRNVPESWLTVLGRPSVVAVRDKVLLLGVVWIDFSPTSTRVGKATISFPIGARGQLEGMKTNCGQRGGHADSVEVQL